MRRCAASFASLVSDGAAEARADAVGYRLARAFRGNTLDALWRSLGTGLLGADFSGRRPGLFEAAGWRLVDERPSGIAPPGADDWRAFLLKRLDATIAQLVRDCGSLANCEFGAADPIAIRHPLSRAVPWLSKLLDMPTLPRSGDHHMPHVQDGAFGASERFAVSPGREADGYLQLPGGPPGIRCRRSIAAGSRIGRTVYRRHSCRDRQRIRSGCGQSAPQPHRPKCDKRSAAPILALVLARNDFCGLSVLRCTDRGGNTACCHGIRARYRYSSVAR
jgi:hypothetical protein